MSLQLYLAFVAACIALALLPGPVVTLVIANGLRHGDHQRHDRTRQQRQRDAGGDEGEIDLQGHDKPPGRE